MGGQAFSVASYRAARIRVGEYESFGRDCRRQLDMNPEMTNLAAWKTS